NITDGSSTGIFAAQVTSTTAPTHITDLRWVNIVGIPPYSGTQPSTGSYTATNTPGSLWYAGALSLERDDVAGLVGFDEFSKIVPGPASVQLPLANQRKGRLVYVKPPVGAGDHLITVTPSGGNTIDGASSAYILDGRDSTLFMSDGNVTWNQLAIAQHLVNPPILDTDIYISPTGLDTNSGLTSLSPVLNLSKALEILFNKGWNRVATINFAAGNHTLPALEAYNLRTTARGANSQLIVFKGNSLVVVTSDTVLTADNTNLSPSQLVTINVVTVLTPGVYRGYVML